MIFFRDRYAAGQKLADDPDLQKNISKKSIVLGIPRGGIEVGYPIARRFFCPLEPITLRKLPLPGNDQVGFGAVTLNRQVILNDELVRRSYLSREEIERITDGVYKEVRRRDRKYRGQRQFPDLKNYTVIIADDGLATGYTMLAAVKYARETDAKKIIVAVPVAHLEAFNLVRKEADDVICLYVSSEASFAVASFYEYFPDLEDEEVIDILNKIRK